MLKYGTSGKTLRTVLLWCIGGLMACSSVEPVQDPVKPPAFSIIHHDIFSERPRISTPREIHRLTPKQQAEFLAYFNSEARGSTPAHQRVSNYLEEITVGFNYHRDTNSAATALERSEGNCLSLAILTTAIAKLANVEAGYQLVDSDPVFEFNEQVILKGVHIRTKLFDPEWEPGENEMILRRPHVLIDYFRSGSERFMHDLSEQDYVARYYLNLAADAISEADYDRAYWLSLEAIEFDSLNSDAFNNLAVIYKRIGEAKKSEEIYAYGIENLPDRLTLLKNYRILLVDEKRYSEARELDARISRLDDPSPFNWFHAAREAYDDGDYHEAVRFYKRAIDIAPYLHEFSFGLAQSYYRLGRLSAAERYLREALGNTYEQKTRALYQAKLVAVSLDLDGIQKNHRVVLEQGTRR